jgi:predicted secreted protein
VSDLDLEESMKRIAVLAVLLALAGCAHAQAVAPAPRERVLTLEAQAAQEVPLDVATITLVAEMEDQEPAALAQRMNRTLEDTLAQAKAETRVDARSGGYRTFPATDRDGHITAWRARAEIILESRDFKALSALAGRLASRMSVGGMSFSLSREAREAEEDRLITQAIARFQARAQLAAKSFGFAHYSLLEVHVQTQSAAPPRPFMAAMAKSAPSANVPVEGGNTTVSVTVSGSVKMEQ